VSSIDCVVTHALFPPALVNEFRAAGIRSVRSTNSVPHPTNAVALEPSLVEALQREVPAPSEENKP
jgi:ribose-phosphate pyrophosphokinase